MARGLAPRAGRASEAIKPVALRATPLIRPAPRPPSPARGEGARDPPVKFACRRLDWGVLRARWFSFVHFHRSGFRSERRCALARRFSLRRGLEARRHRAVEGGQDRLHHRADRQPDRRRAGCRCCAPPPKGASRAPISSRSPTTRCRASPMRSTWRALSGPDRRWPQSTRRISQLRLTIEFERAASWGAKASHADARHRRLSRRMAARPAAARQDPTRNGRARRSRRARAKARAPLAAPTGARCSPASTPPPPAEEERGAHARRAVHRLSAARRATTSTRCRRCRRAAS